MRWLGFVAVVCVWQHVAGHGFLNMPKSRNKLANEVFKEDCPHCLPAGGPGTVGKLAGGVFPSTHDAALEEKRHGMCGDSKESSNPKYNPFPVANIDSSKISVYKTGQSVEFEVVVTTHHYGHFEFFLCDTKDLRDKNTVTQECLFKHILQRDPAKQGEGDYYSPIDPKYPERYYIIPKCLGESGGSPRGQLHKASYLLPAGLECEHCILQWWWATANSCSPPGYDTHTWPANPSGCDWFNPQTRDLKCGGGAYPEEFWNCADIQITVDGTGTGIPAPPPLDAWATTLLSGMNNLRKEVNAKPALPSLGWSEADATDAATSCSGGSGVIMNSGDPVAALAAWTAEKGAYVAADGTCSGECAGYKQVMTSNALNVGCAQASCGTVCKFNAAPQASGQVYSPGSGKACRSKQAHISDAWCETVECGPDYAAFCEWSGSGGSSPPPPTPPAPTPGGGSPSPPAPTPSPPSAPLPTPPSGGEMSCSEQKTACQDRCIKLTGGVKTNQCWGAPDTYVECTCSDMTTLKIPGAPQCKHSSCSC